MLFESVVPFAVISLPLLLSACVTQQTKATVAANFPLNAVAYMPNRTHPRCAITHVVDGDTIKASCKSSNGTIRLLGFDTPETYAPRCDAEKQLGQKAKEYLVAQLRSAKTIHPKVNGKDKYGRTLASLSIDGEALEELMIRSGHAVQYGGGKRINWCARLKG